MRTMPLPSDNKKSAPPTETTRQTRTNEVAHQADTLRLIDPRIAGMHERRGADFVRGLWANVGIDNFANATPTFSFCGAF